MSDINLTLILFCCSMIHIAVVSVPEHTLHGLVFIMEVINVFGRQINIIVDRVILLTEVMVVERK